MSRCYAKNPKVRELLSPGGQLMTREEATTRWGSRLGALAYDYALLPPTYFCERPGREILAAMVAVDRATPCASLEGPHIPQWGTIPGDDALWACPRSVSVSPGGKYGVAMTITLQPEGPLVFEVAGGGHGRTGIDPDARVAAFPFYDCGGEHIAAAEALEQAARWLRDPDRFVEHVFGGRWLREFEIALGTADEWDGYPYTPDDADPDGD